MYLKSATVEKDFRGFVKGTDFPVHFVCHPSVNANGTPPYRGKPRSDTDQSTYHKDHKTRCGIWASARATPHNRSGEDTPVLE